MIANLVKCCFRVSQEPCYINEGSFGAFRAKDKEMIGTKQQKDYFQLGLKLIKDTLWPILH